MKLKTTIAALLAAIGFSSAQATTASYQDLGTINVGGEVSYGGSFIDQVVDTYRFILPVSSNIESYADGSKYVVRFGQRDAPFNFILDGNLLSSTAGNFTTTALSSGEHFVTLQGISGGATAYTGGIFNVSAVPEPETYAMFLAGLGLMGVIAKRRRNV